MYRMLDKFKRNTNSDETVKTKNAPRRAWKEEPEYRPPNTAFEVALISAIIVMVIYVVSKLI